MEEKINQTLLQIEKDLQDVKSAREQVDMVVESCSKLQDKVGDFVSNVALLSQNADNLIKNVSKKESDNIDGFNSALTKLKNTCSDFISKFSEDTQAIIYHFETKVGSINKNADEKASEALSKFKSTLDDLNNSSSYIATVFGTNSEKVINDLNTKTTNISNSFKEEIAKISDAVNEEKNNLHTEIESLAEIETKMNASAETIKNLNVSIENLMTELKQSQSAQDNDLTAIKQSIAEQSTLVKNNLSDLSDNIGNHFSAAQQQTEKIGSDIVSIFQNNLEQYKYVSEMLGKISVNQAENQNFLLKNSDTQLNRFIDQFTILGEKNAASEQKLSQKIETIIADLGSVKQTQTEIQGRLSKCENNDKELDTKTNNIRLLLIAQIVLSILIIVLFFVVK